MQPDAKALTWAAIMKHIRKMEIPEAIVFVMAQGRSQQEATDLVMDFQQNRPKVYTGLDDGPKFTETPFFQRMREKYEYKI